MRTNIEQLIESTGDLLYRVRIYDRDMQFTDEILEMDRIHEDLSHVNWKIVPEVIVRSAVEKLAKMKSRLVTMFEDLLFIA